MVVRRKVEVRDRWVVFHVETKREKEMVEAMVRGSFRAWDEVGGAWGEVLGLWLRGRRRKRKRRGWRWMIERVWEDGEGLVAWLGG